MFQQPNLDHRDMPMMLFEVFDHFLDDLLGEGEVHSPKLQIFVLILDPKLQPGRLQLRNIRFFSTQGRSEIFLKIKCLDCWKFNFLADNYFKTLLPVVPQVNK